MIKYEDYMKACWILGNSQASTDFLRSQFDYGIRQRRIVRGYPLASFGIFVEYDQMVMFKKLWHDLNQGAERFITDMPIFGDKSLGKIVRFISHYNIQDIDGKYYKVTGQVEILKTGLDASMNIPPCPRIPMPGLIPHPPLYPCGTP